MCLSRSSGPPPSTAFRACYLGDEDGDGDVVVMEMMMLTKNWTDWVYFEGSHNLTCYCGSLILLKLLVEAEYSNCPSEYEYEWEGVVNLGGEYFH